MKSERLEAYTDAVAAIIMTIMVLEIKAPETDSFEEIIKAIPYLIAFVISAILICTAWYNQSFLFKGIKVISKSMFWANTIWLITMALIPVTTAWVSEYPFSLIPEYTYFLSFILWSIAYYYLRYTTRHTNKNPFNRFHFIIDLTVEIIGIILIYFFPILGLLLTLLSGLSWTIFDTQVETKYLNKKH